MNDKRINLLNDYLFMKYMGEEGDEVQLLAFLNAVLQKPGRDKIEAVKILANKSLTADTKGDKASVLDVRAVMGDGTKVNIEVQLRAVGNMGKRSLYYWSREYIKGIRSGKDYLQLPKVITINIVGAEFLAIDEVHSCFHLWEDSHKDFLLTDVLEIHFIDMVKFSRLKEKDIESNPFHRWLAFFDKNTDENTLKKILAMDANINRAYQKIMSVLQNEDMLRLYESREMASLDYNSGMNHARREGIAIGEQRGEQKAQVKYALKLHQEGWSAEKITEFTGLSAEEVSSILA
jgi:predicted transposase/invertase (TIGR01784 family)